ncbi:MAG TPA: 2-amino-4-hydroxy-6-hydroxymethyldihydropteridine diphosphokinase [Xanthobacteraceae bacterium]|nr:2-amino-4-hydroxy-6-hydroxymethyldihydropteridine diphosphokinase [Xanthobacteraceae bacterium]
MAEALIALGGNLGDARATLNKAIELFCDGSDVRLLARSHDYRTPPWGDENQPPFVNLCIAVETRLPPQDLLARAQQVERTLGRVRAEDRRWGPRTADLDILAYDDLSLDEPNLTLPHPHLFERAFVLVPLAEIAPDKVIGGTRVRDALAQVDTAAIERLEP